MVNNLYREGHHRAYGECPRMLSLLVDYSYIFFVVSLCLDSDVPSLLKGVYHRNGIWESQADEFLPREQDMAFPPDNSIRVHCNVPELIV